MNLLAKPVIMMWKTFGGYLIFVAIVGKSLDTFVFLFMILCCDIVVQAIVLVKYLMADMKSLLHMGGVSFQQLFAERI